MVVIIGFSFPLPIHLQNLLIYFFSSSFDFISIYKKSWPFQMTHSPYFTTHFDLAFPLPIIFFRWWCSRSPEHFYDEWFDSLWSWPQKQSRTKGDTIWYCQYHWYFAYAVYRYFQEFAVFTFEMENFNSILVKYQRKLHARTCFSIYFQKWFRHILWCILGGHREWIFTRRSFLTAV